MRVAVTGTTGRVGAALVRHFSQEHQVIPLARSHFELADPRALATALARLECDVFLHPAALTSLEMCEDDPTLAMRVNAEAPAEIARWAAERQIPVYHFSTDYVFAGTELGLRQEDEPPAPRSDYGRSKYVGEQAVLAWPENAVIRVSWVFGPEKPSFIDQIYDAAISGKPLAAVADKFSLPTFTTDLAAWTEELVIHRTTGIIHACLGGEPVSWHGIAAAVLEEMHACSAIDHLPQVHAQTLAGMTEFRAARPQFTAMDTRRLTGILGRAPRPWREVVAAYVRQRWLAT